MKRSIFTQYVCFLICPLPFMVTGCSRPTAPASTATTSPVTIPPGASSETEHNMKTMPADVQQRVQSQTGEQR